MSVPYLGDFSIGSIVYVPFNTFDSNDPTASVTITNLANTDIHIHKNDSLTPRNNAAGITMSVDFDTITGNHMVKIDTSENTVADFWVGGADYFVRMEGTTVDAGTINSWIGCFSIENRRVAGELISTWIATLASQTSFTLTAGSADNSAYNNCIAIVSDQISAIQKCIGRVSAYTGATKTVTLAADPGIFTMAAKDNITIIAASALANLSSIGGTAQTANDNGADINAILVGTVTNAQGADVATDVAAAIGTDSKCLISSDAQDLSGTLDVNTKALGGTVQSATDLKDFADAGYDPGTNKVQGVVLTDTCTTNSDMRGTDSAGTAVELAKVPKSDAAVTWNATALASIEAEANDALVALKLDHLVAVADADDVVDDSIIAKLVSLGATADWSGFVNTTDSLQALRDRGDAAWITATAVTVSDKTGFSLSSAGIDAIWDQASSITLSFEVLVERIYQLLNNEMNITDATGAVALRNLADSADMATGSIADDATTTSRAAYTWV